MHRFVALAAAVTLAAGVSAAFVTPATAATQADAATPGAYVSVATARLIAAKAVAAHSSVTIAAGSAVPDDAAAVVVSVSVTAGSRAGTLVASAGDATSAPKSVTVSFAANQSVGDLAVVPLAGNGRFRFWSNAAAAVHVTVDLSGYYVGGTPTSGGAFVPEPRSAVRVADTRNGTDGNGRGAVRPGASLYPHITGKGGVPAGASAVAATVTVIGATTSGTVRVRTSGGDSVPTTMQIQAGRQASQLVIVPLSSASSGALAVTNGTGKPVQIAVDVSGYYSAGPAASASATQAVESSTVATQKINAHSSSRIVLAGRGGVPRSGAVAAIVTLRVVKAATHGTLSASSGAAPTVVQFGTGTTRSGVVIARLADGAITVANRSSRANTISVDVDGYVPGAAVPAATEPSVAHYLDALKGTDADPATMRGYADADASAASVPRLVLLDVGAQSITNPPLTKSYPGVALANSDPLVRITYARLVTDIQAYAAEFATVSGNSAVTIAVGTNNDGASEPKDPNYYAFDKRGTAWATKVITPLRAEVPHGVTMLAADDIEAAFNSTEAQARTWEDSYLAALPADASSGVQLIYNGDANSCPRTPGVTGRTCAYGWTQSDYYTLAYNHGHVRVLPQIFFGYEAAKWADIDRTGNGTSSKDGLALLGALTDHSRDPSHLDAVDARAFLYRALSAEVTSPGVAAAVDFA